MYVFLDSFSLKKKMCIDFDDDIYLKKCILLSCTVSKFFYEVHKISNINLSLRRNPLARSSGQVICPSDKRNFIGTSPNGQVNFLLLDLYLHDHQNGFFKRIQFYNDNFPCPWSLCKRPSSLPVADEKRVYKTIPAIVSTEASAIVNAEMEITMTTTYPKFQK